MNSRRNKFNETSRLRLQGIKKHGRDKRSPIGKVGVENLANVERTGREERKKY